MGSHYMFESDGTFEPTLMDIWIGSWAVERSFRGFRGCAANPIDVT